MTHLRPALVLLVLLTLLTGLAYPFAMTGLAKTLFPKQAAGSLLERNGQVVGSALIGQSFTTDAYFHGRPSATTATDPADATKTVSAPYNAANSSGSNAGPTAKSLIDRVQGDVDLLKKENPGKPIPVDLVTTSGSGLDPHITPAGADFQVPRIAKTRGVTEDRIRALIAEHTEPRLLGVIGEPVVNVLELNLALDQAVPYTAPAKTAEPAAPPATEPAAAEPASKPEAAAKP